MFTFVYQSKANRETLRDFNERLREFCSENPVVNIDATAFGANLIIQGTTADDMDAENVPTFTASVRTINPDDVDLEEQLDGLIGAELQKHKPEDEEADPNLPVKFIVATGEKKSWVVLLCVNGIAEDGGDEGGGDGGDDTTEPAPVGSPAAGFQAG